VRIQQIIKEVAENLQIPYKDVDAIVKFAFSSPAKAMKNKESKVTVRYIGTFIKKMTKRDAYKKFKKLKDENN
jgi:nucleoid DNA-binding protein